MIHYAIYYDPSDYPAMFVVRPWVIDERGVTPGDLIGAPVATLEAARALLPGPLDAMVRFDASPDDDTCLHEVWTL